jgi:HEAT repeat protein
VTVRPEVITALGQLARGGSSFDSRANACRALGILRGRAALPDLIDALRSKDNNVMYESLAAIQKIGDPSAGPRITYLLRDLDDRVQSTAIETAGTLRATDALPTLRSIVASPRNVKAQRSALAAIAMMPQSQDRDMFVRQLSATDAKLRAASAEGVGRIGNRADVPALDKLWSDEDRMAPRLAVAFALVMNGNLNVAPDAPLRYLVNTLNSSAYHDVAYAYLVETARQQTVLHVLYTQLDSGTKEEKIYLGRVLAVSGDQGSASFLDKLSRDNDPDVAREGLRALRSLRARLGI